MVTFPHLLQEMHPPLTHATPAVKEFSFSEREKKMKERCCHLEARSIILAAISPSTNTSIHTYREKQTDRHTRLLKPLWTMFRGFVVVYNSQHSGGDFPSRSSLSIRHRIWPFFFFLSHLTDNSSQPFRNKVRKKSVTTLKLPFLPCGSHEGKNYF